MCGIDDYNILTFHHLCGAEKEKDITKMLKSNPDNAKLAEELGKTILLCRNCHFELHHEERVDKAPSKDQKIRRGNKKRAVEKLGGKCKICGYDKVLDSLEFHHVDKERKLYTISDKLTNKWETIEIELEKCELLCSNCHQKVHTLREDRTEGVV